ncbi:arginine ABC transporter permease ArtM [Arsenophonus sp.]|uniref:arginine ABC transporter permease ArtM n=1 Tax=Arsenophonus sp. TaxID=1872640 RepID=UPI002858C902|nr:arginine ABC transporter permease ArtM [Arsenophonus sp.]MDR5615699.1 arginine ABC transporter permease ArtM [Arsenophonus sp.]
MIDLIMSLLPGLPTSLSLTLCALLIAFLLALFLTIILSLKTAIFSAIIQGYITRYLPALLWLVQFFLIYYGPGQFPAIKEYPALWALISTPWVCALLALALNSAAYSTLLFHGAVKAIPKASWQSCQALGMSNYQTLRIILPYALKRALSSYSNEVILIFKSTSLASTITLLEIMGYSQQIFGQTYNVDVFIAAGIIYLCVNGILTLLMRWLEQYTLSFEKI